MAPLLRPAHHDGAIRVPRRHPSALSPALLEALSFDRRSTANSRASHSGEWPGQPAQPLGRVTSCASAMVTFFAADASALWVGLPAPLGVLRSVQPMARQHIPGRLACPRALSINLGGFAGGAIRWRGLSVHWSVAGLVR
jgi:hypothetical protein